MVFKVERNIRNGFIYKIIGNDNFYGKCNFTYNILLRKIYINDYNRTTVYNFMQTNILQKIIYIITFMWLLPIDLFPKYKIYKNGKNIGYSKYSFSSPKKILLIKNDKYELYLHSNNYISVMKNDTQIALIKKTLLTELEKNVYEIHYDEQAENDIALLLAFIVFSDIVYFPNKLKMSYYKYEKTIGKDKYNYRTLWTSN